MATDFDKQTWLAWLVKVRILILTVLLGIELAAAQFTPIAFPVRLDFRPEGVWACFMMLAISVL